MCCGRYRTSSTARSPPFQYPTARCLVIGWLGATSARVRAMAMAVSGSLDGALMIVSQRAMTERRIVTADTRPPLPAGMCNTRDPNARTQLSTIGKLLGHPAIQVVQADLGVGHLEDVLSAENRAQHV